MTIYDKIRPHLQTGDLALFSGNGGTSIGIKWFTQSSWSHVGMVIRFVELDIVFVWEATTLNNLKDVMTGNKKQGVQLVPLSERLKTYDGDIAVRHLTVRRTKAMMKALDELRQELKGRDYEKNKMEVLKSVYNGPLGHNNEDLSSLFCSELIAETYQRMGLLGEELPSNEYTPKHFSAAGKLKLLKGKLGEEILIKKDGKYFDL